MDRSIPSTPRSKQPNTTADAVVVMIGYATVLRSHPDSLNPNQFRTPHRHGRQKAGTALRQEPYRLLDATHRLPHLRPPCHRILASASSSCSSRQQRWPTTSPRASVRRARDVDQNETHAQLSSHPRFSISTRHPQQFPPARRGRRSCGPWCWCRHARWAFRVAAASGQGRAGSWRCSGTRRRPWGTGC